MTNKQTCLLPIKFYNSIPSDLGMLLLPLTPKFWKAAIMWFQVGLNKFYTWGRLRKYSRLPRVIQKISNSYKMASQSLPPAFHSAFCPDGSKICQRFETRALLWHQTVFSLNSKSVCLTWNSGLQGETVQLQTSGLTQAAGLSLTVKFQNRDNSSWIPLILLNLLISTIMQHLGLSCFR